MIEEMVVPRWEDPIHSWPILSDGSREREAADNYGDFECPFCDACFAREGETITIGDKCRNGHSVTGFKEANGGPRSF